MAKDFFEDLKRWRSDSKENNSKTQKYFFGEFKTALFKDLYIGDLVKVKNEEVIPADLFIISSSDLKKHSCYLETKNLDGETNLNKKRVNPALIEMTQKHGFKNSFELL